MAIFWRYVEGETNRCVLYLEALHQEQMRSRRLKMRQIRSPLRCFAYVVRYVTLQYGIPRDKTRQWIRKMDRTDCMMGNEITDSTLHPFSNSPPYFPSPLFPALLLCTVPSHYFASLHTIPFLPLPFPWQSHSIALHCIALHAIVCLSI